MRQVLRPVALELAILEVPRYFYLPSSKVRKMTWLDFFFLNLLTEPHGIDIFVAQTPSSTHFTWFNLLMPIAAKFKTVTDFEYTWNELAFLKASPYNGIISLSFPSPSASVSPAPKHAGQQPWQQAAKRTA